MLNGGRNSENLENLLDVSSTRSATRSPADSQALEIVERLGSKASVHHELKRRVVHREHDAHRAIARSLGPIGSVPTLQGRAGADESEHGLALFQQNHILHRALSR